MDGAGDEDAAATGLLEKVSSFQFLVSGCLIELPEQLESGFVWGPRETGNQKLETALLGRRLMVGQVPLEHFV